MRKIDDGEKKKKKKKRKKKKITVEIVATNVVASRPPERRGSPATSTARAKMKQMETLCVSAYDSLHCIVYTLDMSHQNILS